MVQLNNSYETKKEEQGWFSAWNKTSLQDKFPTIHFETKSKDRFHPVENCSIPSAFFFQERKKLPNLRQPHHRSQSGFCLAPG
jgi:hypothetical protein